ncbi:conserved hypothetical protein [Nitrospira sp. ND1]|uniref:HEAT repeat domain-containing protein n=1 Tax=Nitrospira sp. ND1 TaxID=1658518 RepID=UPI0009BAD6CD|nr:HEAT repeat domain-containing protein [Nitrospira sp. ND1]SLM43303.1 conserved hypothetical protein [Nitrospira sp. ND1]
MGFKTDTSFLHFLSLGAMGVRQTMSQLHAIGFRPIELERYCTCNKIWMTKVKRLRLPDLLCVRTGIRFEVRAKSDLKIKVSDAPRNPDRTWDFGLRNEDIIAFIGIRQEQGDPGPADEAMFFSTESLRGSIDKSTLGPPKSASEGAERDRTWPAIVPSDNGIVESVTRTKLVVTMTGDGGRQRRQTYTLNGKHVYVRPGDRFKKGLSILAGAPSEMAEVTSLLSREYNPLDDLLKQNPLDRYAAVKAIAHREDLRPQAIPALESLLRSEQDERVSLEAAGSSASLGSSLGQERIEAVLWGDGRKDLRMEAVLILTELGSQFSKNELVRIAQSRQLEGDEIRQAAVWGLGKAGLKDYEAILPFIADADENVALHAIAAFGPDTQEPVIRKLVQKLTSGDPRVAAAASEALRLIGNETTVRVLVEATSAGGDWVLATLGRMPPQLVTNIVSSSELMAQLAPLLLLNECENWLAREEHVIDLAFLIKQNLS